MKLTQQDLKWLVLREADKTIPNINIRRARERGLEKEFFGDPLEFSDEHFVGPTGTLSMSAVESEPVGDVLDSDREEQLLQRGVRTDKWSNLAHQALYQTNDPVAWAAYDDFKKQGLNIFGNEKKFIEHYWTHPDEKARVRSQFEDALETRASRPVGDTGGPRGIVPGRKPSAAAIAGLEPLMKQAKAEKEFRSLPTRILKRPPSLKEQPTPSQIKQAAGLSAEQEEEKRVGAMNRGDSAGASSASVSRDAEQQVATGGAKSVWTSGGAVSAEEPVARKEDSAVSKKIKYLKTKEGMPHKQAVAVALSMKERGELEESTMRLDMLQIRNLVQESLEVILTNDEATELFGDEIAPQLTSEAAYTIQTIGEMIRQELKELAVSEVLTQTGYRKEDKKPLQKLAKGVEDRGTEGSFKEYCGGEVTQSCIDRAAKAGGRRAKQASLAATFSKAKGGGPTLTYPKKDK